MLGYVISEDRDDPNTRMADLAVALMADGLKLAGAVQTNIGQGQDCACDMELTVLGSGAAPVRISQSLGAGSRGCRLDADGLERAVALSARVLTRSTDLLIVNKFGRQEAIGRGFCDLIGTALAEGVPVLTTVSADQLQAFRAFAGDYAHRLGWDGAADWCRGARSAAA